MEPCEPYPAKMSEWYPCHGLYNINHHGVHLGKKTSSTPVPNRL